jgi:hypothetical protein
MKYFAIREAVDTKEVGQVFPQTDGLEGSDTFKSETSFSAFHHHGFPIDFQNKQIIKVHHSTSLTDFISTAIISAHGFIVSGKLKGLLQKFELIDSRFYDIQLKYKGNVSYDYYWFHMFWQDKLDCVDFHASKFELRPASKYLGEIKIKSSEELLKKINESRPNLIKPIQLVIKSPKKDFFYSPVGTEKIVSERLISDFERNKITGYALRDLTNIKII